MGSGPSWYQRGDKTCYIPKVSKFFVDILFYEVSSLVCKCVFYEPTHNAMEGPQGT